MPDCPELSALEGDATKPIRDHIAVCLSCRVVVDLLDERRRGVDARERHDECARFEILLAAREEGTLGGAAGELLEAHLRECADCQAVAATMSPTDVGRQASALPPVSTAAYALGREVARGGMGRILEALDVRIGRRVAVKELLGKAPAPAARFEREARVTARLQHPGIVPIYEIGKWPDGTPFYTMRMIEGRTLREAMRDKTLDERLALLPSIIAAADAVAFAHGKRVIHRDLTPNNVLVGEYGDTVVIDWGLAKDLSTAAEPDDEPAVGPYRDQPSASGNLTTVGAVIGTAAYMPPEQANGAAVDERADVYALGAILYHLLAGEPPYRASKSDEVVRQVKAGPPGAVAVVAAAAPRDLVSIVDKAMARDPAGRYPTARELADELRRFQTGRLVEAHAYSRRERARRWIRARRAAVTVATIALVVLAVGGALALANVWKQRDRAEAGEKAATAAQHRAEEQTQSSQALTVTLLAEQGRQEILAGHSMRALPYLSAAYGAGDKSAETRSMIAAAMHEVDAFEYELHDSSDQEPTLVFSADANLLLAAHKDSIEVWDLRSGATTKTLHAGGAEFARASVAPDNNRVIAWDAKSPRMYLFDIESGVVRILEGHTKPVYRAMFSPDGSSLISASWDSTWRRWDLATGHSRTVATRPPQFGENAYVGFGPPELDDAGARLLTLGNDGIAEVWDVEAGTRRAQVGGKGVYGARLRSDGRRAITWTMTSLTLWDVDTGRPLATADGPGFHITRCAFQPNGEEILVAGDKGKIEAWNGTLSARTSEIALHAGMILPAYAGPHRISVIETFSSDVVVWDVALQAEVARFEVGGASHWPSHDGRRLAVIQPGNRIQIWRLDTTRLRRRFVAPGIVGNSVSIDGSRVAAIEPGNVVTLRDVDHDGITLPHPPLRSPAALSTTRLAALDERGDVVVLDAATGKVLRTWSEPAPKPTNISITPDGAHVLVERPDHSELLDTTTGAVTRFSSSGTARVSPDGTRVAIRTKQEEVTIFDAVSAKAVTTIALPSEPLFDLFFFSPDARRLAMPCFLQGLTLFLFDATTGRQLAKLPNAVLPGFATNEDRMIAAGLDGILHVLRPSDGAEVAKLPIESSFGFAQITADGTRLTIAKADGIAEVRSLVDGRPLFRFAMRPPKPTVDVEKRDFKYNFTASFGAPENVLVTGDETGSVIATWDIHLETRTPAEIAKLVAERVPWRLENGRLVHVGAP